MILATTTCIIISDDSIKGVTQVKRINPATPIALLNGCRLEGAVVILNDENRALTRTVAHEVIQVTIARIIIGKDEILVIGVT